MTVKTFALLDRDGTVIADRHYLADPAGVELLPGAADGMRRLRDAGVEMAIVTNQSGVGKGLFTAAALEAMHDRLRELLAAEGVAVRGIYYCPHTAADACRCRKPLPGLAEAAAQELGIDLTRAFVVGDKEADIDLARAVGATGILVRTGYGAETERAGACRPAAVVDDLGAAAEFICEVVAKRRLSGGSGGSPTSA